MAGNVEVLTYPSAEASSVLLRPSGDSIPAAVSILRVAGSSVSNAAVTIALEHLPWRSKEPAKDVADSVDEQAVSMLIAGPAAIYIALRCQKCFGR